MIYFLKSEFSEEAILLNPHGEQYDYGQLVNQLTKDQLLVVHYDKDQGVNSCQFVFDYPEEFTSIVKDVPPDNPIWYYALPKSAVIKFRL